MDDLSASGGDITSLPDNSALKQAAEEFDSLVGLLVDELKNDDLTARLNAVRRLSTVALALGPERTRQELIPVLEESLDDEDEVLLALANELGTFVEFIGGPSHAHILLKPLKMLASVEETVVRERATTSMAEIFKILPECAIEQHALPLFKSLSTESWFSCRISACNIVSASYEISKDLPNVREQILQTFGVLCRDDTPMVRRAAAKCLNELLKVSDTRDVSASLYQIFVELSQDEQDTVRLLVVATLAELGKHFEPEERGPRLVQSLRNLFNDKSWRVRHAFISEYVKITEAMGPVIVNDELLVACVQLLKDNEAEVRVVAAGELPKFCKNLDAEAVVENMIDPIKTLATDPSPQVRAAVASGIGGLALHLGTTYTMDYLLPQFIQLLKDDNAGVRLNLISQLGMVNQVIGTDNLSQALLPFVLELAEDKQWRVRHAMIQYMPRLAEQVGVEYFNGRLGTFCLAWLGDEVYSVREAASVNLRRLTEVFGIDWAKRSLLPQISSMSEHTYYLNRMTTLLSLTTIAGAMPPEVIKENIIPIIASLVGDPIPNIRFNVAKSLETLIKILTEHEEGSEEPGKHARYIEESVLPVLVKLSGDSDADVRFYASRALGPAKHERASTVTMKTVNS